MWNNTDRQICRSMLPLAPRGSWRRIAVGTAGRLYCGRGRRFRVRVHRAGRHRERDRMGDLRRHRLLLIAWVLRGGADLHPRAAATSKVPAEHIRAGMYLSELVTTF